MHPALRNTLALIAGVMASGTVNMGLIILGTKLLPPPAGVDANDASSINAHIGEYSVAQLMVPFLAHALGTFAGALVAGRLAASRPLLWAMIIGALGLVGGVIAVRMIPEAPAWFDALDLGLAYLPMGWLGARAARRAS